MRHSESRYSRSPVGVAAVSAPSEERQARRIQAFAADHHPPILQLMQLSPAVADALGALGQPTGAHSQQPLRPDRAACAA